MVFEKLDAGILSLHVESVYPTSLVRNSMRIFNIHSREIGVLLELSSGLPSLFSAEDNIFEVEEEDEVCCDKFAVSQVIRNFISNAIKFTPQGGRVIVHICFEHTPASPCVSSDNGSKTGFGLAVNSEIDTEEAISDFKEQADAMHGRLRVSVTDSGVGISPDDQAKLFKGVVQFRPEVTVVCKINCDRHKLLRTLHVQFARFFKEVGAAASACSSALT